MAKAAGGHAAPAVCGGELGSLRGQHRLQILPLLSAIRSELVVVPLAGQEHLLDNGGGPARYAASSIMHHMRGCGPHPVQALKSTSPIAMASQAAGLAVSSSMGAVAPPGLTDCILCDHNETLTLFSHFMQASLLRWSCVWTLCCLVPACSSIQVVACLPAEVVVAFHAVSEPCLFTINSTPLKICSYVKSADFLGF